jgi:hypothetical protein
MKNLKTILSVFALATVFSANAFAQETANVAVTAEVQAAIVLTPTAIALGSIQQAASTIAANSNDNGGTSTNVGTSANAGSLKIDGTSGVSVDVTWANAILTNGTPVEDVVFTPSVYNGSTSLTSGDDVTLTAGSITLDVGGSLAVPGGTGSYTTVGGTPIVFTVQYN